MAGECRVYPIGREGPSVTRHIDSLKYNIFLICMGNWGYHQNRSNSQGSVVPFMRLYSVYFKGIHERS